MNVPLLVDTGTFPGRLLLRPYPPADTRSEPPVGRAIDQEAYALSRPHTLCRVRQDRKNVISKADDAKDPGRLEVSRIGADPEHPSYYGSVGSNDCMNGFVRVRWIRMKP